LIYRTYFENLWFLQLSGGNNPRTQVAGFLFSNFWWLMSVDSGSTQISVITPTLFLIGQGTTPR